MATSERRRDNPSDPEKEIKEKIRTLIKQKPNKTERAKLMKDIDEIINKVRLMVQIAAGNGGIVDMDQIIDKAILSLQKSDANACL